MRPAIPLPFALLALGSAATTLLLAEPTTPVTVLWPGGAESPGVCVEKGSWFVSVVPASVETRDLRTTTLRGPEGTTEGRLLHFDSAQRLCLLETSSGLGPVQPVPLSAAAPPKAGAKAECVAGKSACRTAVAGKDWSYRGERFPHPLLRLRVSETGPHCLAGTPLLGGGGELIGLLVCRRPEASDEVYAVPAARVRKLVEDVKRHQRSGPVWVGLVVHGESSTPEVIEVTADSPAKDAGFRPGDVVLALDEAEIESVDDLIETIQNLPAGAETTVRVLRGLSEETLTMTPRFAEVVAAR